MTVSISGAAATSGAGTVSVDADCTVVIAGASSASGSGTVTPQITAATSGASAATGAGTVVVEIDAQVSGASAASGAGTVTVSVTGGTTTVNITGAGSVSGAGAVSVSTGGNLYGAPAGGRRTNDKHNPYRSVWDKGYLTTHLAKSIVSTAQVGTPSAILEAEIEEIPPYALEARSIVSIASVGDFSAYSDEEDTLEAMNALMPILSRMMRV